MAIIKKGDLKKFKKPVNAEPIEPIEELVDADGSFIEGDRNAVNNSEIETAPQQTTDDFASQAIQPNRRLGYTYGSGTRHVGEEKMITILDRLFENENGGIPNLDVLNQQYHKPIIVSKVQDLVGSISKNNLSPEEYAIVLSHILNNVNIELPMEYKNMLKNSL